MRSVLTLPRRALRTPAEKKLEANRHEQVEQPVDARLNEEEREILLRVAEQRGWKRLLWVVPVTAGLLTWALSHAKDLYNESDTALVASMLRSLDRPFKFSGQRIEGLSVLSRKSTADLKQRLNDPGNVLHIEGPSNTGKTLVIGTALVSARMRVLTLIFFCIVLQEELVQANAEKGKKTRVVWLSCRNSASTDLAPALGEAFGIAGRSGALLQSAPL